ncbi:MAG: polyphosphate polymerase domain-containing protein [Alphaproteobacteria bacterium]|nr:polyphosphate polymerase domain-containing protein [Alphaproteobacteria bacterium]
MILARPGDVQDFSRYEFKYLLREDQRRSVEAEVQHFMQYDGYVDPMLGNQYFVRSLYFDSEDASNFYEKIDGLRSRKKYRIRTYATSESDDAPVFLELKGRHNQRTYKHRVSIDPKDLPLFCQDAPSLISLYPGVQLVEAFAFDTLRRRLRPRVLVDYQRRPYTSQFDVNFRLTFDQAICSIATDLLFPQDPGRFRQCVAGWTVLEIKFHRRIPAWFHRILQAYQLRSVSISKFVVGMKSCGLATDLS